MLWNLIWVGLDFLYLNAILKKYRINSNIEIQKN